MTDKDTMLNFYTLLQDNIISQEEADALIDYNAVSDALLVEILLERTGCDSFDLYNHIFDEQ